MQEKWTLPAAVDEAVATALGRDQRVDPVLPGSGGPAGNARLTAATGLLLLVLFGAELVTLLDVRGFISWHLALGVILIPPAFLKIASTSWRIARYYTGNASYREAGPPPVALRVLGPLVVATTLALLGTGVVLVLLGQTDSRRTLLTFLGQRIDLVTLHQGAFIVWAVATGAHVLVRTLPAWALARAADPVPGRPRRTGVLLAALALAVGCAGWVLADSGGWRDSRGVPLEGRHGLP